MHARRTVLAHYKVALKIRLAVTLLVELERLLTVRLGVALMALGGGWEKGGGENTGLRGSLPSRKKRRRMSSHSPPSLCQQLVIKSAAHLCLPHPTRAPGGALRRKFQLHDES